MTTGIYQDIQYSECLLGQIKHHLSQSTPQPTPHTPDRSIGERLEIARLKRGLTVAELSGKTKIRCEILDKYETSQLHPDICAMHLLRRELGHV